MPAGLQVPLSLQHTRPKISKLDILLRCEGQGLDGTDLHVHWLSAAVEQQRDSFVRVWLSLVGL